MKTKQELIEEAANLAKQHSDKKSIVEKILSDLDAEPKISHKHIDGIAAVNEILKEIEELETKHSKIIEEIKK